MLEINSNDCLRQLHWESPRWAHEKEDSMLNRQNHHTCFFMSHRSLPRADTSPGPGGYVQIRGRLGKAGTVEVKRARRR